MKKFIYIQIEIKDRELLSKLWLCAHLSKLGFTCILGDLISIKQIIKFYPKGIYFDKSIAASRYDLIQKVLNFKHKIASIFMETL